MHLSCPLECGQMALGTLLVVSPKQRAGGELQCMETAR